MNRTRRIGPKTFVLFRKIDKDSGGCVSWNTHPNCRTSFNNSHCIFVTTFLGAFYLVVPQPSCAKTSTCCRLYNPILTFKTNIREDANSRSRARLSIGLPRRVLFPRCTSTSLCWWFKAWSGFWCRFCTLIFIVLETTCVSSRTLSFCFPLIAFSLSSFNTTSTPAIRNHCSCFNSLISGVKVSQSEFLIYASLHRRFQFLRIGHRYLLRDFHVIQF